MSEAIMSGSHAPLAAIAFLALTGAALAQEASPVPAPDGAETHQGWRRADAVVQTAAASLADTEATLAQNPEPVAAPEPEAAGAPDELTIKAGSYVTVRLNEQVSAATNSVGDQFSATLEQPLVVDGIVVSHRGEMVYGRVIEAQKAKNGAPSRLVLALTDLTLADGTQAPLRSENKSARGATTPAGDQAGTVIGTTVAGAAIGGIAARGTGAALGAGAGAMAGAVAVMLTRNKTAVVYPETTLTFRMESPVTISTARSPQAFRQVRSEDYERQGDLRSRPQPRQQSRCRACAPPPYWGPVYYPGWGPYYGSGVSIMIGRGRGGRWWW
jgi:hypothetical protein